MHNIDDVKEIIENKVEDLDFDTTNEITTPYYQLQQLLKELEIIKNTKNITGIDALSLEFYLSELYTSIQKPRYIPDRTSFGIFSKLPVKPYASTSVGSTVIVSRGENFSEEELPAKTVFTTLLPGQITHRWGISGQWRIACGQYFEDFQSHVRGIHTLSDTAITKFNDRDVFNLKKINVINLQGVTSFRGGGFPVCPTCLSIDIKTGLGREQCDHVKDQLIAPVTRSSLYAEPLLENTEIIHEREIGCEQEFSFPLNHIFEKIIYLENTRVLTVATGFSRSALDTIVQVDYDPYLGYETDTNGLIFRLKEIPDAFIELILHEKFLVRDIILDIFIERITPILKKLRRTRLESELWLSGIIKSLELDSISDSFDHVEALSKLNDDDFERIFLNHITTEISFYENPPIGINPQTIEIVAKEIKKINISKDNLKSKIRSLLKNSLSYLIYNAGIITSGSTGQDMGFIIPDENSNDILIYDNESGGNGASKLIDNYLIGEQSSFSSIQGVRPKFFQETFFELLHPCSQGTADRIYFQNLHEIFSNFSSNNLITKKFEEIIEQQHSSPDEFIQINGIGIQNMFPNSIGKRSLIQPNGTASTTESKKIQEISNICIHGCFECGLLQGNYSGINGPKLERFYVSKYLIDLYFRFISQNIRVDVNTNMNEIEQILKQNNMIIISQQIDENVHDFSLLMKKIQSIIGEKFDGKLIKFSGLWFDCPISNPFHIEVSILLGLIK
jgi:hypothetical protein